MSVVLDDNQQQHLLVILNDINRHIHESNLIAIASTTSITTTTTTNTNDSNGTIAKKGGGAGSNYNRHPNKRASTIDHHPPSLPQPDMITGFNQNNISQLSNFIINTNRYFVAFYKLTSGDIFGADFSQQSKGKSIATWLNLFYPKALLEHLKWELLFDSNILTTSSLSTNILASQHTKKDHLLKHQKAQLFGIGGNDGDSSLHNGQQQQIQQDMLMQQQQQQINNLLNQQQQQQTEEQQIYLSTLETTTDQHHHHHHQQQQQQHQQSSQQQPNDVLADLFTSTNTSMVSQQIIQQHQQPTQSLSQPIYALDAVKDLTFLIFLITNLFYKLRHSSLPSLVARFDISWQFFANFQANLDTNFNHDVLFQLLQVEIQRQRTVNERRTEQLKQEVQQLTKIHKLVEREIETEINRLMQLQAKQKVTSTGTTVTGQQMVQSHRSIVSKVPSTSGSNSIPATFVGGRTCPECGKTFRNAYKLNRHLYVHKDSSEKPYSCDWSGCAYRSISRNDLNRHKMIHTGEKPYHCDVAGCEKRYSRPDKLRHHKLTIHYKEQHNSGSIKKEQVCIYPGCSFHCSNKTELSRHQALHHQKEDSSNKLAGKSVPMQKVQSQQAQNHQGKPNQYVTLSAPISIRSANIPGGTVPSDLAQVIANLPQQINNQQQQTTLSNSHITPNQLGQQTQSRNQQTLQQLNPQSMIANNQTISQILQHQQQQQQQQQQHQLSGDRLAAVAAAAAAQSQSQAQAATMAHIQNLVQQSSEQQQNNPQVVVVPSSNTIHHQQPMISAVVSGASIVDGPLVVSTSNMSQQNQQQQSNQQQQQQQGANGPNTISVWSN